MYLGYYILFTFLLILLFVGQKVTKKPSLLKKLNGSVANQFATCSACGTRLLRKLKQSSAIAASALLFKVFACFLNVAASPKFVLW